MQIRIQLPKMIWFLIRTNPHKTFASSLSLSPPSLSLSLSGSECFPSRIHYLRSASKKERILTPKNDFKHSKQIWSGFFMSDPDPDFLPIPDPGVKKATLFTILLLFLF